MKELTKQKFNFLSLLRGILSSDYFPIFTAAMSLANYYLGFDLLNIYIFAAVVIAMILLLDDLTPLFSQFLFLAVIASEVNTPMYGTSNYYTQTAHFVQIGILVGLIIVAALYRIVKQARAGRVHLGPMFISVIVLAAVYLMNGVFSSEYEFKDTLYGAMLAATLLITYALFSSSVKVNEANIKKICLAFFMLSVVLVIELVVALTRLDVPLSEVTAQTMRLECFRFGWGMWNNMGMLLVICIAPVLYLALKTDKPVLFIIWATVVFVAVIVSTSRQSYIGAGIAYIIAAIYVLVKSRGRKSVYIAFGVVLVFAICAVGVLIYEYGLLNLFNTVTFGLFDYDGDFTGSLRVQMFEKAVDNFLKSPVLGVGFYADNMIGTYYTSMSWFPFFYHNTAAQIMGSCGILGIAAYLFHRGASVVSLFRHRSTGKFFIAISMLAYLIMGLMDNHMFYILSAFVYPIMTVYITNPAEKEEIKAVENVEDDVFGDEEEEPAAYAEGADEFLDGLTPDEREEFFAVFSGGNSVEYVTGGDNEKFFKQIFVKLGSYLGIISYSLLDKIYKYSERFDFK